MIKSRQCHEHCCYIFEVPKEPGNLEIGVLSKILHQKQDYLRVGYLDVQYNSYLA
jgi:hypothetical protein